MTSVTRKVAIVGGGWSGCAAAVELARHGHIVTLFEATRTLGGRARRVEIEDKVLDNGQHILLGAYTETLRLLRLLGIDTKKVLRHLPLQMRYPPNSGGMDFIAPSLPAPLHLLLALWRATGLAKTDKWALARFSTSLRWIDWRLHDDCTVTELLERFDQTERLTQLMWQPLCIAALNTPPERASAQIFLNVLRDSLGARRSASDMLLPCVDLTTLFPQQTTTFIEKHGGCVRYGSTVKKIDRNGKYWQLAINNTPNNTLATDGGQDNHFDNVIIATQAAHAAILLEGWTNTQSLRELNYEPITTCYLQYAADIRLEQPFFALVEHTPTTALGQFVFDRGQLDANQSGLLAVVISASSEAIALGHADLAKAIARQLANAFGRPELARPKWVKVISEKRATFSCTPALARPDNKTLLDSLFIAGDYTASDYPATLESATRSGVKAARAILDRY
jgi:hydroxysqualene dehydroxylase